MVKPSEISPPASAEIAQVPGVQDTEGLLNLAMQWLCHVMNHCPVVAKPW